MKFSTQEEYGLRCLIQIARHHASGGLTIPEISQAEGLSEANAAKLLRVLRIGGFIDSSRGHAGGYTLSRPADQIPVGEVLALLGGRLYESDFCEKHTGFEKLCTHNTSCSVRSLWQTVQIAVDKVLHKITVQDMLGSEQTFQTQISIPILQSLDN
ncbi:Rrf2 family transcriptional regulator [bacterium]|nr:Rrf2 family transcriptional regulator [bacterium]